MPIFIIPIVSKPTMVLELQFPKKYTSTILLKLTLISPIRIFDLPKPPQGESITNNHKIIPYAI